MSKEKYGHEINLHINRLKGRTFNGIAIVAIEGILYLDNIL